MSDAWLESFEARRAERAHHAETVTVDGVTLTLRPGVAPQVAVRYYDAKRRLIVHTALAQEAAAKGTSAPEIPDDLQDAALLDLFDETMRACITDDSLPALAELRAADRPNPLGWVDLWDLAEYLLARVSGVPTGRPADSSNGSAAATGSSTDGSPSPARTRKR